jgi:hypothetical protein
MAKAGGKGILLGDYIKFHAPEPSVRVQLDRGELRYEWVDADRRHRASDDGDPLPPKGWWLATLTTIDRETSEVRGQAHLAPFFTFFQPMFFVRVFPAVAPADTPSKAKRPDNKFDLVLKILADIDRRGGLASNLQPAEVAQKVLPKVPPELRLRWEKVGPDGRAKPAVSRRHIYRAYQKYLEDLLGK